ncbi:MAG: hypothetical protein L6R39_002053 [Caloplaca ligustica]|nr:MAG: hypothetical protein L6R39_002053 [Caloplaca ligustica]
MLVEGTAIQLLLRCLCSGIPLAVGDEKHLGLRIFQQAVPAAATNTARKAVSRAPSPSDRVMVHPRTRPWDQFTQGPLYTEGSED